MKTKKSVEGNRKVLPPPNALRIVFNAPSAPEDGPNPFSRGSTISRPFLYGRKASLAGPSTQQALNSRETRAKKLDLSAERSSLRAGPAALDLLASLEFLEIFSISLTPALRCPEIEALHEANSLPDSSLSHLVGLGGSASAPSNSNSSAPSAVPALAVLTAAQIETALIDDPGDTPDSPLFILHQSLLRSIRNTRGFHYGKAPLTDPAQWQGTLFRALREHRPDLDLGVPIAALNSRCTAPDMQPVALYAAMAAAKRVRLLRELCDLALSAAPGLDPSLHAPEDEDGEAEGALNGEELAEELAEFEAIIRSNTASLLQPLGVSVGVGREKNSEVNEVESESDTDCGGPWTYFVVEYPGLLSIRLLRMRMRPTAAAGSDATVTDETGEPLECEILASSLAEFQTLIKRGESESETSDCARDSDRIALFDRHRVRRAAGGSTDPIQSMLMLNLTVTADSESGAGAAPTSLSSVLGPGGKWNWAAERLRLYTAEMEQTRRDARAAFFLPPPPAPPRKAAGAGGTAVTARTPSSFRPSMITSAAVGVGVGGKITAAAAAAHARSGPKRLAGACRGVGKKGGGRFRASRGRARGAAGGGRPSYKEASSSEDEEEDGEGAAVEEDAEEGLESATASLLAGHPPLCFVGKQNGTGQLIARLRGMPGTLMNACVLVDPFADDQGLGLEEIETLQAAFTAREGAVERAMGGAAGTGPIDTGNVNGTASARGGDFCGAAAELAQLEKGHEDPRAFFRPLRLPGEESAAAAVRLVRLLTAPGEGPWAENKGSSRRMLPKGPDGAEAFMAVPKGGLVTLLHCLGAA